jgi:hypothetical protein
LIDESVTLRIGRLSFRQHLSFKASEFGIKSYEVCDGTTGYLSFLICVGKNTKLDFPLITADANKTAAIVLKLVEPLLIQGQTVWMVNFYNSPCLARTVKTLHKTEHVSMLKQAKESSKKVRQKLKNRQNNGAAFWPCFCHRVE